MKMHTSSGLPIRPLRGAAARNIAGNIGARRRTFAKHAFLAWCLGMGLGVLAILWFW